MFRRATVIPAAGVDIGCGMMAVSDHPGALPTCRTTCTACDRPSKLRCRRHAAPEEGPGKLPDTVDATVAVAAGLCAHRRKYPRLKNTNNHIWGPWEPVTTSSKSAWTRPTGSGSCCIPPAEVGNAGQPVHRAVRPISPTSPNPAGRILSFTSRRFLTTLPTRRSRGLGAGLRPPHRDVMMAHGRRPADHRQTICGRRGSGELPPQRQSSESHFGSEVL